MGISRLDPPNLTPGEGQRAASVENIFATDVVGVDGNGDDLYGNHLLQCYQDQLTMGHRSAGCQRTLAQLTSTYIVL